MVADQPVVLLGRVVFTDKNSNIVDAEFIGDNDHSPAFDSHARRPFIVAPIANVFEAFSRQMIGCVESLAQSWPEPTFWSLAGCAGDYLFHFVHDRALFLWRIIPHRNSIGQAVAEPFPVTLIAFLDYGRMLFANFGVQ